MSYGTVQAEKVTTESGYSLGAGNASSFKNRIINGGMTIDQRNAGASVTPASGADTFPVDRFSVYSTQASKTTAQQNQGSVTPPAGFTNYLGVTSSSSYSVLSTDLFGVFQNIEGYNVSDLGWGTANAKTITLSFWVYSSLTGTFGGAIANSAQTRSYVFSYTINSANTWEYKTVTIPGDTTGTWLTTTGRGITLCWSLGMGSNRVTTAGSWNATTYWSVTGGVNIVGTSGATFYITGVQLEVGTVATSFDFRSYGTELALCQRYFQIFKSTGGQYDYFASGAFYNSTQGRFFKPFLVTMRTSPSLTVGPGTTYVDGVSYVSLTSLSLEASEPESIRMGFTASSAGSNATGYGCFLASSTSSLETLSLSAEL